MTNSALKLLKKALSCSVVRIQFFLEPEAQHVIAYVFCFQQAFFFVILPKGFISSEICPIEWVEVMVVSVLLY